MYAFMHIYTLLSGYIYRDIYIAIYHMYQEYIRAREKLPGEQEGMVLAAKRLQGCAEITGFEP